MKEYIEREATENEMLHTMAGTGYQSRAMDVIRYAPTADVVEVTYCRDCTYCDPENKHCDHPMGTSLPVPRKDNDFCSYGVRKED